jgi:hypothetical protein
MAADQPEIRFSVHTEKRATERGIGRAWIEQTVLAPDWTRPDPDPALTRAYKAIPENGGRVLRVVFRPDGAAIRVITAHFDRGAKR